MHGVPAIPVAAVEDYEADEVGEEGHRPGDRVGEVEGEERRRELEDRGDPDDPEETGACKGDDCRSHRVAQSPD